MSLYYSKFKFYMMNESDMVILLPIKSIANIPNASAGSGNIPAMAIAM